MYKSCIEYVDLIIFVATGFVEASSTETPTERWKLQYVEEICKKNLDGEQLYLVNQAVNAEARNITSEKAEEKSGH